MSEGKIWLGNVGNEVLLPNMSRTYAETDTEITQEKRTASGKLVIDIIAEKKEFTISYTKVTDDVLQALKNVYSLGNILNLKVEDKEGTINAYTVKIRPFGRTRVLMAKEWLWEGISIKLEEI